MFEFILFGGMFCIAYLTVLNLIRLRRYNRAKIEKVVPSMPDVTTKQVPAKFLCAMGKSPFDLQSL